MLTALVLAGALAAAPPPALAPGTYTYTASFGGQRLGTSTITVKADGGGTEIDEHVSGSYQGSPATGSAMLLLAPDLSPSSYRASGDMGGVPVQASATIANGTATIVNSAGKTNVPLSANAAHFVVVDLDSFVGFMPLAAQMQAWSDRPVTVVVPSFGKSLAAAPQTATPSQRPAGVPARDAAISFDGEAPFTIWYDPATFIPDEIDTAQGITIVRSAAARS